MSIPIPSLDDRTFQQLVDEAKRLIPEKCPQWTNHNVSDPGVALIEIFAWMTELTLYRINQLPDRLYSGFLNLVGVRPFPSVPAKATTALWLSGVTDQTVVVPAGTVVSTQPSTAHEPESYLTDLDVVMKQPLLITCLTGPDEAQLDDRWDDLEDERSSVVCFSSRPTMHQGDGIYFGFAEPLPSNILQLEIDAKAEGPGIDPNSPPIRWEAWTDDGWAACRVLKDETGGLNRPGPVWIVLPHGHSERQLADADAAWLRCVLAESQSDEHGYRASPRITTIHPTTLGGTVTASHGRPHASESLGISDGTPGQTCTVGATPVLERRPDEHVRVITSDGATDWEERSDFSESNDDSLHYTWDSVAGRISFGPSIRYANNTTRQHGAIPPKGAEILVSRYRTGGGEVGNVPEGAIASLSKTIPYVDRVENLDAAHGGLDGESVANAKLRGPMSLRTGDRAVTAADYERLAKEASRELARTRCLAPERPGSPLRLLLVPEVPKHLGQLVLRDLAVSDEVVTQVREHLEPRRLLGTTVEVLTPYYQGVTVAAQVFVNDQRDPTLVQERAVKVLNRYLHPIAGGLDGSGWDFGNSLTAAMVSQLLIGVDGVARVADVLLFEVDAARDLRFGQASEIIEIDENALFLSVRHRVVTK